MGNPVRSDVHIDVALSNVSIKYKNAKFVAEELFPVVMTSKDSNKYFVYGKENFNLFDDGRAPATRGAEIDWTVSTDSYLLGEHALTHAIPDEVRDDADEPLKIETDTTEYLTEQIKLRLEADVASASTSSANYAATNYKDLSAAGNAQWNDYAASNPIEDVKVARVVIHSLTGLEPNILILGKQVYDALTNHPMVIERIKFSQLGVVTTDLLAAIFDVEQVLVATALKNTVIEGETASLSYVWGKNAVLAYRPSSMGLKVLSYGALFRRAGWPKTETWRQQPERADYIRVSDKYQAKIISNVAGYLMANAVA